MKSILIIVLIGLIQGTLISQNYLFNSKSSGFHIAGLLGTSTGSTLLGIRPGYTFDGKLTTGLVVGSENISDLDSPSGVQNSSRFNGLGRGNAKGIGTKLFN